MKDRKWFEAKLAELRGQMAKLKSDYNAIEGAAQFCEHAIAEIDAELGIPLDTFIPGATVETPAAGANN